MLSFKVSPSESACYKELAKDVTTGEATRRLGLQAGFAIC